MIWRDRMEDMRTQGCIVALRLGPFGWSCTVTDPDVDGINVAQFKEPDEAVQAAFDRWTEKKDAWAAKEYGPCETT